MSTVKNLVVVSSADRGSASVDGESYVDLVDTLGSQEAVLDLLSLDGAATPRARQLLAEQYHRELPAQKCPVCGQQIVFTDGVDFIGMQCLG